MSHDRPSNFTLPESGHGDADGAVGHASVMEETVQDHGLHDRRTRVEHGAQQKSLGLQCPLRIDQHRLGALSTHVETMGLLRARTEVVQLLAVHVTDQDCDNDTVYDQSTHGADRVGLASHQSSGAVVGIDREVGVHTGNGAGDDHAIFFADEAESVGEDPILNQELQVDLLSTLVSLGDPVAAFLATLVLRLQAQAVVVLGERPDDTSCGVLHGPHDLRAQHVEQAIDADRSDHLECSDASLLLFFAQIHERFDVACGSSRLTDQLECGSAPCAVFLCGTHVHTPFQCAVENDATM